MSSIRNIAKSTIGLALLILVAGGCESTNQYPIARLNPTPVPQDEAMALRQWDQNHARYANSTVSAFPTLYPYQAAEANGDLANAWWAPALYVGQTIALPVTAIMTPPWDPTVSRGVYVPPTYTADVPLEPIN